MTRQANCFATGFMSLVVCFLQAQVAHAQWFQAVKPGFPLAPTLDISKKRAEPALAYQQMCQRVKDSRYCRSVKADTAPVSAEEASTLLEKINVLGNTLMHGVLEKDNQDNPIGAPRDDYWSDLQEDHKIDVARIRSVRHLQNLTIDELKAVQPVISGDCEEYTFLKRSILEYYGFPLSHLYEAVVYDEEGAGHAVLVAEVMTELGEKIQLVLDNKNNDVMQVNEVPYEFVMVARQDRPRAWYYIEGQAERHGGPQTVGQKKRPPQDETPGGIILKNIIGPR